MNVFSFTMLQIDYSILLLPALRKYGLYISVKIEIKSPES